MALVFFKGRPSFLLSPPLRDLPCPENAKDGPERGENCGDDPEAHRDLRLRPAERFEVMVDGRAEEHLLSEGPLRHLTCTELHRLAHGNVTPWDFRFNGRGPWEIPHML